MKKWTIFDREIEWYDIKTKFKKLLRGLLYSFVFQWLITSIIYSYIWLVFITGKKKFLNQEKFLRIIKLGKPLIICFWHNRLMMMPHIAGFAYQNANKDYKFMTLASNHGDGQFVGHVMKKFGFENIYGSTQYGRKSSRGIDIPALRGLIRGLKNGKGLGITPDGPRGPNQKVNGDIIHIAKISNAQIISVSYSCSRFKQFNSWDKFKLPLPFSELCFYYGEIMNVAHDADEELLRLQLEKNLNDAQEKADLFVITEKTEI